MERLRSNCPTASLSTSEKSFIERTMSAMRVRPSLMSLSAGGISWRSSSTFSSSSSGSRAGICARNVSMYSNSFLTTVLHERHAVLEVLDRRVDLVRHAGGEPADGFVTLDRRQAFFGSLAIGDVVTRSDDAGEIALLVAHRHLAGEDRAVHAASLVVGHFLAIHQRHCRTGSAPARRRRTSPPSRAGRNRNPSCRRAPPGSHPCGARPAHCTR